MLSAIKKVKMLIELTSNRGHTMIGQGDGKGFKNERMSVGLVIPAH